MDPSSRFQYFRHLLQSPHSSQEILSFTAQHKVNYFDMNSFDSFGFDKINKIITAMLVVSLSGVQCTAVVTCHGSSGLISSWGGAGAGAGAGAGEREREGATW